MLSNLPVSYWLFSIGLPPFSIIVVYISTALLNLFISKYLLKRFINFDIKYLVTTARAILVLMATLPLFFIITQFESTLQRFIITIVCSPSWLLVMIYYLGLSRYEKTTIYEFVSKKYSLLQKK